MSPLLSFYARHFVGLHGSMKHIRLIRCVHPACFQACFVGCNKIQGFEFAMHQHTCAELPANVLPWPPKAPCVGKSSEVPCLAPIALAFWNKLPTLSLPSSSSLSSCMDAEAWNGVAPGQPKVEVQERCSLHTKPCTHLRSAPNQLATATHAQDGSRPCQWLPDHRSNCFGQHTDAGMPFCHSRAFSLLLRSNRCACGCHHHHLRHSDQQGT